MSDLFLFKPRRLSAVTLGSFSGNAQTEDDRKNNSQEVGLSDCSGTSSASSTRNRHRRTARQEEEEEVLDVVVGVGGGRSAVAMAGHDNAGFAADDEADDQDLTTRTPHGLAAAQDAPPAVRVDVEEDDENGYGMYEHLGGGAVVEEPVLEPVLQHVPNAAPPPVPQAQHKAVPNNVHGRTHVGFMGIDDDDVECKSVASLDVKDAVQSPEAPPVHDGEDIAPKELKKKSWDAFKQRPSDHPHAGQDACYEASKKVLKVFLYLLFFCITLAGAAITTATLLYAASNVYDSHNATMAGLAWEDSAFPLICLDYSTVVNRTGGLFDEHTNCVAVPPHYDHYPLGSWEEDLHCLMPLDNAGGNVVVRKRDLADAYQANRCGMVAAQWVWCLLLMQVTPYALKFVRCVWYVAFKTKKGPAVDALAVVLGLEFLHTLGSSMFLFAVLPLLDNALEACVLLPAVSFVPSVLNIFCRPQEKASKSTDPDAAKKDEQHKERIRTVKLVFDLLACLAQTSALLLWPVLIGTGVWAEAPKGLMWSIPLSLLLVSVGWWENYIDDDSHFGSLGEAMMKQKKKIKEGRSKLTIIVCLWKIVWAIAFMCIFVVIQSENAHFPSIGDVFHIDYAGCEGATAGSMNFSTVPYGIPEIGTNQIPALGLDWLWVYIINMVCGLSAYFSARAASKAQLQKFSMALPLVLVTPVLLIFLMCMCDTWTEKPCQYSDGLPTYAFFKCYAYTEDDHRLWKVVVDQQLYMVAVWWLSQLWITRHIWFPRCERLAKTDKLFLSPLYDGIFLDQSLAHNRNRHDEPKASGKYIDMIKNNLSKAESAVPLDKPITPMIYFCATMWHENAEEMVNMLKSIFRMDRDQAARRNAQLFFKIIDRDFYEFEAHIFFDDAMEKHGLHGGDEYKVNTYVQDLVKTIDKAGKAVHNNDSYTCDPPTKYATPYGGRLEWTLPGGNKITAHLKDKIKIRHKKRWSQVMYMYYFLAHRLVDTEMRWKTKQLKAENTFLLALDGDVDFEPSAVTLLVDLMKRNLNVGAACGRIHPIGSGPMVWYQMFEYALGHWMQKATEHVIGCVLCSPGCFSLFRGAALMDDNVMNTYTTMATEAKHYVQYDQGEDRWLCTLLLQQGYRVEYCAASDALTQAPEDFKEFYNQRRRWGPSTMANIMDVLMSWRETTKVNEDISVLYIVYQTMFMVLSLLGPGTIFLMIVGALEVALADRITMWTSLVINLIPVVGFIILCFTVHCDTQVGVAFVMSGIYAIMQMVVLVGICIQMSEQGTCSPTFIFFFYVAGTFLLAAVLHPQEFFCVVHGVTYFLAIPSMYMLLIIYGMCNIDNVSWGTREVVPTKTELEMDAVKEQEAKLQDVKGTGASSWSNVFTMMSGSAEEEGFTVGFGNLFRCICCPREKTPEPDKKFVAVLKKLDMMEDSIKGVEESIHEAQHGKKEEEDEEDLVADAANNWSMNRQSTKRIRLPIVGDTETDNPAYESESEKLNEETDAKKREKQATKKKRDEMVNPFWIEAKELGSGPIGKLTPSEVTFFEELIEQYLKPLDEDKVSKEKIAKKLKELKNMAAGAFLMLNAIFVVTILVLQLNLDTLAVPWPCGENLMLEPIGFVFLICFVSVMLIQTLGMIMHRANTALHTASSTVLECEKEYWQKGDAALTKRGVNDILDISREYCTLSGSQEDQGSVASSVFGDESETDDVAPRKMRKTLKKIEQERSKVKKKKPTDGMGTMDQAFIAKVEKLTQMEDNPVPRGPSRRRQRNTRRTIKNLQALQQQHGGLTSQPTTSDSSNGQAMSSSLPTVPVSTIDDAVSTWAGEQQLRTTQEHVATSHIEARRPTLSSVFEWAEPTDDAPAPVTPVAPVAVCTGSVTSYAAEDSQL